MKPNNAKFSVAVDTTNSFSGVENAVTKAVTVYGSKRQQNIVGYITVLQALSNPVVSIHMTVFSVLSW